MAVSPSIEAIAVVGSRNQRLYLGARVAYQESDANKVRNEMLRLEYAAHCALDVVEERAVTRAGNGEVTPSSVSFLGLVLTLEDLAIYAMVTNTKLRILLLLSPGESRVRDLDCLTILRAVHTCYLSHVANPFHALPSSQTGQPHIQPGQANVHLAIQSPLFDKRIRGIGGW